MRLQEVALSSCWLVVDETDAPTFWTLHVFGPSKTSEALQLYNLYDGIIAELRDAAPVMHSKIELMQYRTDNGFHIVATGRPPLPEDIFFLSFTQAQAQTWISEHGKKVRFEDLFLEAVEIEPDSSSLSRDELKKLLVLRVSA